MIETDQLTDLEKFQIINACEAAPELAAAITMLSDAYGLIQGRSKEFNAERMAEQALAFIGCRHDNPRVLTREFGIRQQAIYIKYSEALENKQYENQTKAQDQQG